MRRERVLRAFGVGLFIATGRTSRLTGKAPLVGESGLICRASSLGCLSLPSNGPGGNFKSRNYRGFYQQLVSDFSGLLSEPRQLATSGL